MKICSWLIVFLIGGSMLAQQPQLTKVKDSTSIWQMIKYDGKAAWGGFSHALTRPLEWDAEQWTTAGIVVGGTVLLAIVDEDTSPYFREQEEDVPKIFRDIGLRGGSPQVAYGLTGSVYVVGLLTKNEKIRETGVLMITSASVAGLIQTITKAAAGRARPQTEVGAFTFKPFSGESGFRSFPSGHTVLSVTAAHSIAKQFKNPWVKTGIYLVGAIAPVSRLWNGAHWLSDVALSAAISIFTVDAIHNYLNENEYYGNRKKKGISWNVQAGLGRVGIVGSF